MRTTRIPVRSTFAATTIAAMTLGVAPCAIAQVSGTVTLRVTDDAGEPQPFAGIELKGLNTSYSRSELTEDPSGEFRFVGVPVGSYRAQAFVDGYTSEILENIEVTPSSSRIYSVRIRRTDFSVEYEADYDEVDNIVDPTKTGTWTTMTDKFIAGTPVQNRDMEGIIALVPGVTRMGSTDSDEISIAGGGSSQIGYRIDGSSVNDAVDGGLAMELPASAIASATVTTGGVTARSGEHSTGLAEFVTKSGENELDFAYDLNFRDTDIGGLAIGDLEQVQRDVDAILRAEGTLLENEAKEGFRLLGVDPISTTEDDPNPPPRRRIEHAVSAGGPIVHDKAFFHVTLLSRADDFGSSFNEGVEQNDELVETSKLNLNVWESGNRSNRLELTTNADISDTSGFRNILATRSTNLLETGGAWNVGVNDIHVFEKNGVLTTRLQVSHQYETSRPEDVRSGAGTQYTIPLPPAGFGAYNVGATGASFDQSVTGLRTEASYARAVGKDAQHTIELGGTWDQTIFDSHAETGDQVSDLRIVNDSAALSGIPAFVGRATTYGPALRTDDAAWFAALYAQDTWRVTQNLTLDLGLRAEYQSFVGRAFVAPRFGFSLDPVGNKKTRFFGNWGIYYDRLFLNALQWEQQPDSFNSDILFTTAFQQGRRFSQTPIDEIYREALSTPEDSTQQDSVAYLVPTFHDRYVLSDDVTAPTIKDWTLGFTRQIPGKIRVEVSYRANERTHQSRIDTITRSLPTEGESRTTRDRVYGTTGTGSYRGWTVQIFKTFDKKKKHPWTAQLSYVQSKNIGPVQRQPSAVDPNDTAVEQGVLGNDRTHVVKLQANTMIMPKRLGLRCGTDFTWQTGLPYTTQLITRDGQTLTPLGQNTQRLPSTRQLNLSLSRDFSAKTTEGRGEPPTVQVRLSAFNLLGALNVVNGIEKFETPPGSSDPASFQPLRPELLVTGVDVGRSLELGLTVRF